MHQNNNSQLIPYIAIGSRTHDVTMAAVPSKGVREDNRITKNSHYLIGAIYNISVTDKFVISPEVAIGRTTGAKVGYKNWGGYANSTSNTYNFELEDGEYYNIGVKANYFISDKFSINGSIDYKHYKFGESKNKVTVYDWTGRWATYIEPASTNDDFSVGLGLSYHF